MGWSWQNQYISQFGGFVAKSCPTLATLWTVACQVPLSMGFSRQEYWSGLPFPSPGDLPNPGIKWGSPALQADSLPGRFFSQLSYKGSPVWYELIKTARRSNQSILKEISLGCSLEGLMLKMKL